MFRVEMCSVRIVFVREWRSEWRIALDNGAKWRKRLPVSGLGHGGLWAQCTSQAGIFRPARGCSNALQASLTPD